MSIMKFFHRMGLIAANPNMIKGMIIGIMFNVVGLTVLYADEEHDWQLRLLGLIFIGMAMATFISIRLEM